MRKEPVIQQRVVRARTGAEKEICTAGCAVTGTPGVEAWEPQGHLFRIHAFEELEQEIDVMAGEIQRLSGSGMTSAEEVQVLGSFLSQLLLMAKDMEDSAAYREGTSLELSDRSREFETMVCILRSNLDQIAMRACA